MNLVKRHLRKRHGTISRTIQAGDMENFSDPIPRSPRWSDSLTNNGGRPVEYQISHPKSEGETEPVRTEKSFPAVSS